jgi:Queuine tRNA-ribosyltransferase
MKFLYSDTQDYVDPKYDFINDRNAPGRKKYWDDMYAHELMTPPPYDGLLVAISAVRQAPGVAKSKVRYSTSEEQRLLRDGVRKFLRMDASKYKNSMLMGDCGAFAYADLEKPAFSPEEVCEFYNDANFTHGISPDHIIFACDEENPPASAMDSSVTDRFDITLTNAAEFLKLTQAEDSAYEPLGAVQGWSPDSMANAARNLEKMGYRYLAIGGLVPLKVPTIHKVLQAIRSKIRPETKIHLLGFAKAEKIHEFLNYGITSFDSTSPLIRAFKDAKANYYMPSLSGGLNYYAAIRIPQAIENSRLLQGIKRGTFSAEDLQKREQRALKAIRAYDKGYESLDATLEAVTTYQSFLTKEAADGEDADSLPVENLAGITKTLKDRPWQHCQCSVCRDIGVEVIIFRSSNRNKRRGFHNLAIYHNHVKTTMRE